MHWTHTWQGWGQGPLTGPLDGSSYNLEADGKIHSMVGFLWMAPLLLTNITYQNMWCLWGERGSFVEDKRLILVSVMNHIQTGNHI